MRVNFTVEEWTEDAGMIGMKDYLVQLEIYWENAVGGNSMVYLENCLGLATDSVFVEFFQYFQRMLNARINNFVDLTV